MPESGKTTNRANTANTANGTFALPPQLCENLRVWMRAFGLNKLLVDQEGCASGLAFGPQSRLRQR